MKESSLACEKPILKHLQKKAMCLWMLGYMSLLRLTSGSCRYSWGSSSSWETFVMYSLLFIVYLNDLCVRREAFSDNREENTLLPVLVNLLLYQRT